MSKARFITFEGGEGAGKSTQIKLLHDNLKQLGYACAVTREPGGAPGAEAIRDLLVTGDPDRWDGMTELLLHFAARRNHVENTIRPALDRGDWVLCDRFTDSTIAYQGYGHGIALEKIELLRDLAIDGLQPDLTFIIDVPLETGLTRAAARRGDDDRYERMDRAFHERLRHGFREIAANAPDRCAVIDGTQSIQAVSESIFDHIRQKFSV